MDLEFSEEQRMFKDALERVVRDKIEPLLASYPEEPLPRDACVKIREILLPMGVHTAHVPLEHGGSGSGAVGHAHRVLTGTWLSQRPVEGWHKELDRSHAAYRAPRLSFAVRPGAQRRLLRFRRGRVSLPPRCAPLYTDPSHALRATP